MKPYVFLIGIFIFFSNTLFSQTNTDPASQNIISSELAYAEDFSFAIPLYKRMISFDIKNPIAYYKLGFCYLNTFGKQDSSIRYLRQSSELYTAEYKDLININEIDFRLAQAYRVNNYLDSSIIILEHLKRRTYEADFLKTIDKEIQLSLEAINNTINVENLGELINTSYAEHSPVLSADKSVLIFTSRKKNSDDEMLLPDGEYDEDIYISRRIDGSWLAPELISDKINTPKNEASISLSSDGKQLFIYKDEDKGSIFYSDYIDGEWTTPIKLGKNINTRHRETHASLSADGKALYFTSNRPGGQGGLDIYVSHKLENGTWGEAINLEAGVNSPNNEDAPHISIDGRTLYFSSVRKEGFGGYDVYKSELTNFNTWRYAENLGYPTNSIDDDLYYTPIPHSEIVFYTSYKKSGYGEADLYILTDANNSPTPKEKYTVHIGRITNDYGMVTEATILVTEQPNGREHIYKSNEIGIFIFVTEKRKKLQTKNCC